MKQLLTLLINNYFGLFANIKAVGKGPHIPISVSCRQRAYYRQFYSFNLFLVPGVLCKKMSMFKMFCKNLLIWGSKFLKSYLIFSLAKLALPGIYMFCFIIFLDDKIDFI